jgi:hypothetical protein
VSGLAQTDIDPYGAQLHVVYDRRGWALLKRRFPGLVEDGFPDADGWARHSVWHPKNGTSPEAHHVLVVDVRKARSTADLVNTIAHEAAHVAGNLMGHIGHHDQAGEPTAYLVGWITQFVWEHLPERKDAS